MYLHKIKNRLNLVYFCEKTTTYDIDNPSPGLKQAQKCGGVDPNLPFLITESPTATVICTLTNNKKPAQIPFHSKIHVSQKLIKWHHKHGQDNSWVNECL